MMLRLQSGSLASAGYFTLGAIAIGVYFGLPAGNAQSAVYVLVGASSAAAMLAAIRLHRPSTRAPWLLFALGTILFVAGDVADYAGVASKASDGLYLAGYPLLAAGLLVLIFRAGAHHRLAAIDEAGIATFAFAIFQWVFVMRPALNGGGSLTTRSVSVAYTGADLVLLAGFAGFFVSAVWRKPAFVLLVAAVAALLVGDEIYAFTSASYVSGDPVDAAWLASYLLFGAAALHPSMRELGEPRRSPRVRVSNWRILLLTAALLSPPTILLTEWARGKDTEVAAIFSASALISVLVVWRLTGILRALETLRSREREVRAESETAQMLLAEQNERLREADRLKDEFVSLISHDLRTPLTSVIGYAELALEDDGSEPLDAERKGYLEIVSRNAQRLLRLVDDLLFIARLQAGRALEIHVDPIDLAAIARQAVLESQPHAQSKGIDLRYEGAETAMAPGDRGRLFQLLDNLVGNAIKFTPAGGLVEVAVEQAAAEVVLEVRDTGIGLAPGDAERLFERFYRTDRATAAQIPGTGLGLFIAHAITEAHGGRISAHPGDGGGTVFRVELPLETPPAQPDEDPRELVA